MKKRASVWFLIILLVTTAVLASGAALAEEEKKEEPKYKTIYYMEQSDTVFKMQAKLKQLGYFEEGEIFTPGALDNITIYALQRFYEDNQYGWPLDGGIAPGIQEFLIEGSPDPRPTPESETPSPTPDGQPTPFPQVLPGEKNDEVISAVQIALYNKGYYEGIADNYVLGSFDAPTEEAVKRFCEAMRITYNPTDGITLPLFNSIIAENAPVYATPSPTPYSIIPYSTVSEEVRSIQNKLNELDYFRDYGEPVWGEYEEITQKAVRRFCEVNRIPVNQNGMDAAFYERLMNENALTNPTDRREMLPNDQGSDVQEIQDRLFSLGYYKDRQRTGVYDEDMSAALAAFAGINQIEYDGKTLTLSLQDAVFNEKAVEYSETTENTETSIAQKLTGAVHFMGVDMPLFVLILLIVIILAALVYVLFRVFGSGKGQQRTAVILGLIVLLVFMVLMAFLNLSVFFILLILLVLGVCLLRMKKPEVFSIFSREKKQETASDSSVPDEKRKDEFSAHIILLYQGGVTTQQIPVDKEEFTIGRSQDCSFVLSGNTNISRKHAIIRYDSEQRCSTITDSSSHGTKVNGESLVPGQPRTLHNGDLIQIEDRILTVQNKNY